MPDLVRCSPIEMGRSLLKVDGGSVLELAGLALIVAGVAFIWWPLALVVAGLGLIWVAYVEAEQ